MCRVYFEFAASSARSVVCLFSVCSFRTRPMWRMRNLNNMLLRGATELLYSVSPCCYRTKEYTKQYFRFAVCQFDPQTDNVNGLYSWLLTVHYIQDMRMCDICAPTSGHKNCLSYRQPTLLPLAIYFALCCQGFVPKLKCIYSPSPLLPHSVYTTRLVHIPTSLRIQVCNWQMQLEVQLQLTINRYL